MESREVTQLKTFLVLNVVHFPRLLETDRPGPQLVPDLRITFINNEYYSRSVSLRFPEPVPVAENNFTLAQK